MKIAEGLGRIERVRILEDGPPVVRTVIGEFERIIGHEFEVLEEGRKAAEPGLFRLGVACPELLDDTARARLEREERGYVHFQLGGNGSGMLMAREPYFLYHFVSLLKGRLGEEALESVREGKTFYPAFAWQRISYDYFLTQAGRVQRHFDREAYLRRAARLGITHVEVNGLAFPMGLETGPKGEIYPMFYTYCPALDQFVYSRLNKGIYPRHFLSKNLAYLKENARLARKYGLSPGLLCFEPRSVPESFFDRYPMLRGARVDHPFRSFKPRYNMTIAHPAVRAHYAEMLEKLMAEVPELGYLCIWTNDSGAGFEHTKSLYVGRNGGPYLIREWKDDGEIARLAGENALRFFRLLRDAATKINTSFRVITRMESFYGEHDTVWTGLGGGIDVEGHSLVARGWETPYTHPRYPDSHAILGGTVYQHPLDEREIPLARELETRGGRAHFYFAAGPHMVFEPLLGVPYPHLAGEKLKDMHKKGVRHLAHAGGLCPPSLVPFPVNHEIARLFSLDPGLDLDKEIEDLARAWAGDTFHRDLLEAWKLTEEAILAFPNVVPMYSMFGFTWYRLWVRPFVPNLGAVPEEDRAFYEDFICTTPHNPNNVDLSRDVLFQLAAPGQCRIDLERIDRHVRPPMDRAVQRLAGVSEAALRDLGAGNVIEDQLVRLKALRCWFMTQRSLAAWIAGVHGYMDSMISEEKSGHRDLVRGMIHQEIENTRQLKELLKSGIEFMAMTDLGENPLIHPGNLEILLDRRIELMERHVNDEPHIEPDYMVRRAAGLIN